MKILQTLTQNVPTIELNNSQITALKYVGEILSNIKNLNKDVDVNKTIMANLKTILLMMNMYLPK